MCEAVEERGVTTRCVAYRAPHQPESRKLMTREELAGAREARIDEHVEALEQAALGVRGECGRARVGGRAIARDARR